MKRYQYVREKGDNGQIFIETVLNQPFEMEGTDRTQVTIPKRPTPIQSYEKLDGAIEASRTAPIDELMLRQFGRVCKGCEA